MTENRTPTAGAEYVTDVAFVRQFCPELSPVLLGAVAAINGFPSPPTGNFDYCEIGCGTGDSLVAFAAASPHARFVGVDINAEHIEIARALAARTNTTNVRFVLDDFESLAREGIAFDYIAAYGFVSWVSPAKREALMKLAARMLKTDGILFVSYNALPAWSAIAPLRKLLLDATSGTAGSLARAEAGLAIVRQLSESGAEFFTQNPVAKTMIGTMARAGARYIVHEYLHAEWHPMYFEDLAREMRVHDLHFGGQLPLYRNVAELTIPTTVLELASRVTDRIAFETMKDYATNEFLRCDIFVKGARAPQEAILRAFFETTRFGTLAAASRVLREVRLPHFVLRYEAPIFAPLIAHLAERPSTLADLMARPEFAAESRDTLRTALLRLFIGEQIVPMPPDRAVTPLAYNRAILSEGSARPTIVASSVTGSATEVSGIRALALHIVATSEEANRAEAIRDLVARHAFRLFVGERAIDAADEKIALITREVDDLVQNDRAKMIALGVLQTRV